ncbi:MAG: hypothetical protein KDC87_04465 [Planctomycetes bacterium]|nr:hypothetical protein [Planctomycetota bacterium]MCB9871366.1 hypothetical protein [Planctomycetota bacterium]MCB9888620.1 hypothetical protein [Planctomycetota bacterium]
MSDGPGSPPPLTREGCYVVAADGRRYIDLAHGEVSTDPAERTRLSLLGDELAAAFHLACAEVQVLGSFTGCEDRWQVRFAGQENASPELIARAFADEARAAGLWVGDPLRLPSGLNAQDANRARDALVVAVRRLRSLLIEHNSYLSGGLRYPFARAQPGVAERGMAIYRFPALAEVDVRAVDDAVEIAFAPGPLQAITSSGFYLPTLFSGDLTVEARYRLGPWQPASDEAACFALFVHDRGAQRRYYAQRMSTGDGPHRVLASLVDRLTEGQQVEGLEGAFRIRRSGAAITCEHAATGADWEVLGTAVDTPDEDLLLGAKIWSKVQCGGLAARVFDLQISGTMADRQDPPAEVRRDPRSDSPRRP